jgi:outer membrane protein OmpA-like peptidoglycan-associated protein
MKPNLNRTMRRTAIVGVIALAAMSVTPMTALAQAIQRSEAIASSDVLSQISMFSYREGPKSQLFLRGTPIAANAQGRVQVEYQNGNAQVSVKVEDLPEPGSLGPYTTYVLWAATPDGRATNQGVLVGIEGGKGEIDTSYSASQFALIVTAEPHFAVSVPSTMIALYNVGDDVKGTESKVTTLTERADYSTLTPIAIDKSTPLEVVQARYAVAIAKNAGADRFAMPEYVAATKKLDAAERALLGAKSAERKTAPGLAREAVTAGEDARRAGILASAAAATNAERLAATNAANDAAAVAARAATASTAAATQLATEAERQRSAEEAAETARRDLLARLSSALPTRSTDRGLVSEIGGVQFATGTATLGDSARENLAKFSGIVASYPALRFNVEGHTDSTGSVATNNELSMQRAITVRDYLIQRGVAASSIDVAGLGSSRPVADETTADARARNRRVEIVLSGGPLAAR